MPEAFNVAPRQRSIPDVSSQKITTPLCHHLVAFIPLSLCRASRRPLALMFPFYGARFEPAPGIDFTSHHATYRAPLRWSIAFYGGPC